MKLSDHGGAEMAAKPFAATTSNSMADLFPTVLITGAGTGIGLATAELFLERGYGVIASGRRAGPLDQLAKRFPDRVLARPCDIADAGSVDQFVTAVRSSKRFYDGLCVIVNNAGIYERAEVLKTSDVTWTKLFETNLLGAVRVTRPFEAILSKNKGVIVNVSSNLGLKPIAETSAYSAVKAAMINWTQSLALELGDKQIRANCVCPGIIETPIHPFFGQNEEVKAPLQKLQPLGRIGQPRDVAHAIFSVSGPGSEWMTGAVLTIDGGIILKGS
jgi:NAD(P)-dependent dehydrogenase (short-subunit alcohol dehydrogenase family)